MPRTHILFVDDDENWLEAVSQYLRDMGNYVEIAHSISEVQSALLSRRFDVVFTNLHLLQEKKALSVYSNRDWLGVQVIRCVHRQAPGTPCFIISGEPNELNERLRGYPEYVDFFLKPALDLDVLDRKISNLETYRNEIEVGYRLVELRVIGTQGRAGKLLTHITADPIEGIEALIVVLEDVPELRDRIPALGVRLSTLKELKRHRDRVGLLSDTQQYQWREAVYFAVVVCQELDVRDRMNERATS